MEPAAVVVRTILLWTALSLPVSATTDTQEAVDSAAVNELLGSVILTADYTPWELMHALLVLSPDSPVITESGRKPLLRYLFQEAEYEGVSFFESIKANYTRGIDEKSHSPFLLQDHQDQFLAIIATTGIDASIIQEQGCSREYSALCKYSRDFYQKSWLPYDGAWTLVHYVNLSKNRRGFPDLTDRIDDLVRLLSERRDTDRLACEGAHDTAALLYYLNETYGTGDLRALGQRNNLSPTDARAISLVSERCVHAIEEIENLDTSAALRNSNLESFLDGLNHWGHALEWLPKVRNTCDRDAFLKSKLAEHVYRLCKAYRPHFGRRGAFFHALHGLRVYCATEDDP